MIPLKDDIAKRRFPVLTVLLIALDVALFVVLDGGLLVLGVDALLLWIFGASVEDSMGRARYLALCALGALATFGLMAAVEPGAATATVAASGAVATLLGSYAVLYPRAQVVTLVLAILFFTVIALPALAVMGAGLAAQLALAVAGVDAPLGPGEDGTFLAQLGGFLLGLLAIRLFADRAHSDYAAEPRLAVHR